MTQKQLPRPRQVTLLGAAIMVGSVFVVLLAFQQMAALGSIEAQESAADLIADPPADGLGLTVDDVQSILRIMCVVAGGAAVAAAILGWQVFQRARSARLALSVLAPVLLVAGFAASGFMSAVVVAAIAMLWAQPARDWFNGVATATPAQLAARPAKQVAAPEPRGTMADMSQATPPDPSPSQAAPAAVPAAVPAAGPAPGPVAAYGAPVPTGPTARPGTVLAAAITTIAASAIVLAGLLVTLLFVLSERSSFESDIADELAGNAAYDDLEPGTLVDVVVVLMAICAAWAVAAIVLAVLTMRGSNGARITLVVSSFSAALVSLLGVLVIAPLLVTAACVAVAVLLLRGDAVAWFRARKRA